jgi:hypothetical protein
MRYMGHDDPAVFLSLGSNVCETGARHAFDGPCDVPGLRSPAMGSQIGPNRTVIGNRDVLHRSSFAHTDEIPPGSRTIGPFSAFLTQLRGLDNSVADVLTKFGHWPCHAGRFGLNLYRLRSRSRRKQDGHPRKCAFKICQLSRRIFSVAVVTMRITKCRNKIANNRFPVFSRAYISGNSRTRQAAPWHWLLLVRRTVARLLTPARDSFHIPVLSLHAQ